MKTESIIVSYDLNGRLPSHKQVDDVLEKLGAERARILETVWWVGYWGTLGGLYRAVNAVLSANDRLIVVEAKEAWLRNLLPDGDDLVAAWQIFRP